MPGLCSAPQDQACRTEFAGGHEFFAALEKMSDLFAIQPAKRRACRLGVWRFARRIRPSSRRNTCCLPRGGTTAWTMRPFGRERPEEQESGDRCRRCGEGELAK
jgi:hypothetical protein